MCCGNFSFVFSTISAIGVVSAHIWFYYLNQDKLIPIVNIFGYHLENVSTSDLYTACIIWITTLFLVYIVSSCSCCQSDPYSGTISRLRREKEALITENNGLKNKLTDLQQVASRIELMVPYDLNTLIEKKMFSVIPRVIYSPMKGQSTTETIASRCQYAQFPIHPPNRQKAIIPSSPQPKIALSPLVRATRDLPVTRQNPLLKKRSSLLDIN